MDTLDDYALADHTLANYGLVLLFVNATDSEDVTTTVIIIVDASFM